VLTPGTYVSYLWSKWYPKYGYFFLVPYKLGFWITWIVYNAFTISCDCGIEYAFSFFLIFHIIHSLNLSLGGNAVVMGFSLFHSIGETYYDSSYYLSSTKDFLYCWCVDGSVLLVLVLIYLLHQPNILCNLGVTSFGSSKTSGGISCNHIFIVDIIVFIKCYKMKQRSVIFNFEGRWFVWLFVVFLFNVGYFIFNIFLHLKNYLWFYRC